jgi:hypothetical protein
VPENKTKPTRQSVTAFIAGIGDNQKRADVKKVAALMRKATGARPRMWGTSIVGYGQYHYKYASGREGDFLITGFSPRKVALTLYIMTGFDGHEALMKKLGKYKTGRSCLYIKRLVDVDVTVLDMLISNSVDFMRQNYDTR